MPNKLKRLLSFVVAIAMFITAIPLTVYGMGTSSATYTDNGEYITGVTDSRGNTTEYTYNETRGYVDYVTNAKDVTTDYTYNASELLTGVTVNDSSVSYTYDSAKRLSTITSPSGTVYTFTYDSFGRVVSTKINTSRTLSTNVYNEKGLLESMTYGNGNTITYGYDEFNRQNKLYINGILKAEYVYDGSSRIVEVRDIAGDRVTKYTYDILGRLVNERLYKPSTLTVLSRVDLRYDNTKNRIAGYDVTVGSDSHSIDYVYGSGTVSPDLITGVKLNGNQILSYEYDALNRISTRTLSATATPHITAYTYLDGADETKTTTLIGTVTSGNDVYSYTYDELGNITSVSKNGTVIESYTYDELNQLTSATIGNDTYTYTYDNGGNILSEKKNGTTTKSYVYGDSQWKDLLTSFKGETITYDAIGNPLNYRDDMSFTWSEGRKLTGAMLGANEYEYTYGTDGLRTQKTVNGEVTTYTWLNGVLYAEETANYTLLYFYDESGIRIGFTYKTATTEASYYYVYNLQGDVVGILDSTGTQVVSYTYDVWGKVLSTTGTLANTIGFDNPIRYRGYYYDYETGFYYLQTRYYDPIIGRFINADGLIYTGQGILGFNMYAYCGNNPANYFDPLGNCYIANGCDELVECWVAEMYPDQTRVLPCAKKRISQNANSSNSALTQDQINENAELIYFYFLEQGWESEPIYAVLGNMQQESGLNPGQWQIGGGGGLGLVQWDPAGRYIDWATQNGYAVNSMFGQLEFLITVMQPGKGEWFKHPDHKDYYLSYRNFIISNQPVAYLTEVFLWSYERPSRPETQQRINYAISWEAYFSDRLY